MQNIDISIVIPIYNTKNYINECLDSLLEQSFKDFEIICVDDGSTDNSCEIIKEYIKKDKRIKLISQKNLGAGQARNNGIKHSKGKYIQFLDSDDYFEFDLLEKLYKLIEENNSDIAVCSYKKINDNREIIETKNPNSPIDLYRTPIKKCFNKDDFSEYIFSLLTPIPWNKMFRKSLIIENGIKFPNLNISEDIAFVHSCIASAKKIIVSDEELINYRYNRKNSMATYRTKYAADVLFSCLALKDYLINKNLYEQLKESYIEVFKNHIRWEIAQCSDSEYQIFLENFKKIIPKEEQILLNPALKKDYITIDYLNKIISDKKVMLWGASIFLQKLLEAEKEKNPNILGIIDKNSALWNKKIGNYTVFSPDSLHILKPNNIIMTVWSNYETLYPILKKEIEQNYPNIKLMSNIFEEEI